MFICTLKASNIKFFAAVLSAVALLITLVAITGGHADAAVEVSAAPEANISFEKVRTNDDRIGFLSQFGWEVLPEPVEEVTLKLPGEFDRIMNEYNEIQKSQGLDLTKYKGEEVVRYTYEVTNYPEYDGRVLANIIVCRNRVVGGDVCSADTQGFIGSLYRPDANSGSSQGTDTAETTQGAPAESVDPSESTAQTPAPVGNEVNADMLSGDGPVEQADAMPQDDLPEIGEAAYDAGGEK